MEKFIENLLETKMENLDKILGGASPEIDCCCGCSSCCKKGTKNEVKVIQNF